MFDVRSFGSSTETLTAIATFPSWTAKRHQLSFGCEVDYSRYLVCKRQTQRWFAPNNHLHDSGYTSGLRYLHPKNMSARLFHSCTCESLPLRAHPSFSRRCERTFSPVAHSFVFHRVADLSFYITFDWSRLGLGCCAATTLAQRACLGRVPRIVAEDARDTRLVAL
jgi:hypothetical protein